MKLIAEALNNFGSFKNTTNLSFHSLNTDRVMFSGNSLSAKKLIYYMIGTRGTTKAIPTLMVLWRNSTYVKGVIS